MQAKWIKLDLGFTSYKEEYVGWITLCNEGGRGLHLWLQHSLVFTSKISFALQAQCFL